MNDNWIKTIVLLELILSPGEETKIPEKYVNELLKEYLDNKYLKISEFNPVKEYYILEVTKETREKIISDIIPKLVKRINSPQYVESMPYDVVTNLIFEVGSKGTKFKDNEDDQFYIKFNGDDDGKLLMEKINRNIRLSKTQFNQIIRASEEARKISNQTLKDIASIKEIKGQIYSEFIAIIGIFSALIFGLFGGFEGIKGVLSLFEKDDKFGIISMYCGLVTLMIVTITFALIQFVGRLIGRNLKSCCCKTDCKCKPQDKYNIYTICVYISIGMILLGAALTGRSMLIKIIFSIIIIGIALVILGNFPKNFIECFKKIKECFKKIKKKSKAKNHK